MFKNTPEAFKDALIAELIRQEGTNRNPKDNPKSISVLDIGRVNFTTPKTSGSIRLSVTYGEVYSPYSLCRFKDGETKIVYSYDDPEDSPLSSLMDMLDSNNSDLEFAAIAHEVGHYLAGHLERAEVSFPDIYRDEITKNIITINPLREEPEEFQKMKNEHLERLNRDIALVVGAMMMDVGGRALVEEFQKVTALNNIDADRRFVNILIKRGGYHQGVRYVRTSDVTFPFYEFLKSGNCGDVCYEVQEKLITAFETLFPGIDKKGECNFASNREFDAGLTSFTLSRTRVMRCLADKLPHMSDHRNNARHTSTVVLMRERDRLQHIVDNHKGNVEALVEYRTSLHFVKNELLSR